VLGDLELNRAQPSHPGERSAERAQSCVGSRAEVPQASPERPACKWVLEEILLERFALAPVARRLGTVDSLPHDRFTLTAIHHG
jgi:hypothetical protein